MYSQLPDNHFYDRPKYETGNVGICPLNPQGFEEYLGYNSFNYHYLQKIPKEIIEEYNKELEDLKNKEKKNCQKEYIKKNSNQIENQPKPETSHEQNKCNIDMNQSCKKMQDKEKQNKGITSIENAKTKPKPKATKKRSPFENDSIKFNNNRKINPIEPSCNYNKKTADIINKYNSFGRKGPLIVNVNK